MRWILRIFSIFRRSKWAGSIVTHFLFLPRQVLTRWPWTATICTGEIYHNVSFPPKDLHGTKGRPFLFYSVLHLFSRKSYEMRLGYLPFTACQVKEEVCLHEALIPVFTTLPEIRKLFSLLLSIRPTCTLHHSSALVNMSEISDCILLQYNSNISTPLHLDTCLNFSWRKRKHQ